MNKDKCHVYAYITNGTGEEKRYSLTPLSDQDLGADNLIGFRLVNRSEEPSPVYAVRLPLSGAVSCDCPAFEWDKRRGESPNAPPNQPAPSCKHCDALRAANLLPVNLVSLLHERTRLLDRAEQTVKNRDLERQAAIRNTDSLRATIGQLESSLRTVEGRAKQLQTALAAHTAAQPRRRSRTAKAA